MAALTSTFQIKASVLGADVTPPSRPTDLNATVISTSQVNLTWTASTDDFNVAGYQVFRDNVQIATSTNTSYIDTGLTPVTTYSYTVTAFDATPNISTASDPAVAVTQSVPSPTPTPSGGGVLPSHRALEALVLQEITVTAGINRLDVDVQTNHYSVARLAWGVTSTYEQGTISGIAYQTNHQFILSTLEAATIYYLKIELIDLQGQAITVERIVQTLPGADTTPPPNVTELTAVVANQKIYLHWQNPVTADFAGVRVVRSSDVFTPSPYGGLVMYQDKGTSFTDSKVVPGHWYFYSVFSYDSTGNYASGALVSVAYNVSSATAIPVVTGNSTTTKPLLSPQVNLELVTDALTTQASSTPWQLVSGEEFALSAQQKESFYAAFGVVIISNQDGSTTSYFLQPQEDGSLRTDALVMGAAGAYEIEVQWYNERQKLLGVTQQLLIVQAIPAVSLITQLMRLLIQKADYILMALIAGFVIMLLIRNVILGKK